MDKAPRIIVRGDDLGSYAAALPAMQEGVKAAVLKCVSVVSCGPFFLDAVPWLKEVKGVDIGCHLCISAEFYTSKWGPLTHSPSLVDDQGHFTPSPNKLNDKGFVLAEVEREVRAQLKRFAEHGIKLNYFDEHMGFGWLPEVRPMLIRVSQDTGIAYHKADYLSYERSDDFVGDVLAMLESPKSDGKLFVLHPAKDGEEMRSLCYDGAEPGQVARERDEDRRFYTDPRVLASIREGKWVPIRWSEA